MARIGIFLYGLFSYAVFLGVFVYGLGFIGGFATPTMLDGTPHRPLGVALAINLGLLTAFALQHSQRELNVLARAERVGGEIRARAIVVAGQHAADVDAVGVLRLGVGDVEGGEDGMIADIL